NMISGETQLVTERQPTHYFGIGISPAGDHLTYFRDKNWYCFHIKTGKTVNLLKNINGDFINLENQYPRDEVFDWPAWTPEDEYVILTDKYDLWAVKPDGTDAKRLTKGKESNHSYTIDQNDFIDDFYKLSYSGSRISKLLNQEAFLVKVTDRNS